MRVRLGLRLGLGGGSPSRSVLASRSIDTQKDYLFLIRARPLYRLRQIKIPPSNGGMPSLLQIVFEKQEKSNGA